jgi:hypothetical protein
MNSFDRVSITDRILAEPEGGTASLGAHEVPTTGYFVGGVVASLVLDMPTSHSDAKIHEFVGRLFRTLDAEYVGWWVDGETGKLYVDGTSWHADYDEAESVCRQRHEIAFYDIENQRDFRPVVTSEA